MDPRLQFCPPHLVCCIKHLGQRSPLLLPQVTLWARNFFFSGTCLPFLCRGQGKAVASLDETWPNKANGTIYSFQMVPNTIYTVLFQTLALSQGQESFI